ncbi:MAG: tyrosine-type recombinase/integrase [Rhizobiales bacterium]|nr:tyrosine-type recombinase/integrase [Hyphomicrobiales bacterium]
MPPSKKHKSNSRYLTLKHNTWYFHRAIPISLKEHYGRSNLSISLQTADFVFAQRKRDELTTYFNQEFKNLKNSVQEQPANEYEEIILDLIKCHQDEIRNKDGSFKLSDEVSLNLAWKAEELEEKQGYTKAKEFYDLATGQEAYISKLTDKWISEIDVSDKTGLDYTRQIEEMVAYTKVKIIKPYDKQIARYYLDYLIDRKLAKKTINSKISAIRTYWRWLVQRGYAETNPWIDLGLTIKKHSQNTKSQPKEPWTDEEVHELIANTTDSLMRDAICIGIYSGMRINEICELKVRDCLDNKFEILVSKTAAGIRSVPVHSELFEIVARRVHNKSEEEYLLEELKSLKPSSTTKRSDPLSKKFGRYHRKLFGDQRIPGQRQSPKDFHSLRRSFVTKAEMADQPPWIIAAVVGHERKGMTLGTYSAGPSFEQLRKCVEAVRI